jgi:hypothetical protein
MKHLRHTLLTCAFLAVNASLVTSVNAQNPTPQFYPLTRCYLNNVSASGDGISMGDGSHWKIAPENAEDVRSWQYGDILVISPSYVPLSTHAYWIKNVRKNTFAAANLFLCTEQFGKNSHWVQHLNPDKNVVYLENRVGFQVDFRDQDHFKQWAINDTIIMGVSNTWFSSFDILLINVNLNHYVRAKLHLEE